MKPNWPRIIFVPLTISLLSILIYRYSAGLDDYVQAQFFERWGLVPKSLEHFTGMWTFHFLHGSQEHLWSNISAILFLGLGIGYFYRGTDIKLYLLSFAFIGPAMWLAGRGLSPHIGASGLVYAMAAFLLGKGLINRDRPSIALALVVVLYYSGMFWSLWVRNPGVSWEGHFYGMLLGFVAAWLFKSTPIQEQKMRKPSERHYFLPRDTFEPKPAEDELITFEEIN